MNTEERNNFKKICRKAAADSAVLLRNYNGFLPLDESDKVALFGRAAYEYTIAGTGSGGLVFVEYNSTMTDGFSELGYKGYDKEIEKLYRDFIKENPYDTGEEGKFASEPRYQKEYKIPEEEIKKAAKRNDKALIFISRRAGEEKEVLDECGSFRLLSVEKSLIRSVTKEFSHVGIVFNTSHIIDMSWVDENWCHDRIDGLLYVWTGGVEGGHAEADLLLGRVSPSGHLADSVTRRISDHMADKNYGDLVENFFEEDIYVGYRYLETFEPKSVLYPFGFGLTYTDFLLDELHFELNSGDKSTICVTGTVQNIGERPGAEVVQVYYSAPDGKLGRPAVELAGFKKTGILAPGEKERVSITFDIAQMAAYDDIGSTGNKSSYVLEEGEYKIFAGFDSRSVKEVTDEIVVYSDPIANDLEKGKDFETVLLESIDRQNVNKASDNEQKHFKDNKYGFITENNRLYLKNTVVVKKLTEALAPNVEFTRIKSTETGMAYESVPATSIDLKTRIVDELPSPSAKELSTEKIMLSDVADKKASLEAFVSQLSDSALSSLVLGEGFDNPNVMPGSASAFGGLTEEAASFGIPIAGCADGPSGIHTKKEMYATEIPIATALACTWDPGLVENLYKGIGKEMEEYKLDVLLGPGINIHRHPLCGRNFEYYSEDPYLAGKMAAAAVRGIEYNGCAAVIKHCCANSQERGRFEENNVISERALREIYLKPFEMAVKEGKARSIMTSYNMVNGHHTSACYDLTTTIIRNEWGFTGMIMTDWWARLNDVHDTKYEHSHTDVASMIRAQNDIYMVIKTGESSTDERVRVLLEALEDGRLTRAELERSAKNILNFIVGLPVMKRMKEQ